MNDDIDRAMRFCDTCGVAMGLMTLNEYTERFIDRADLCPYCGKPAVVEHTEEEVWLTVVEARTKYNVSITKLTKMIKAGEILWRAGGHYTGGRQVREMDVERFGKRAVSGGAR